MNYPFWDVPHIGSGWVIGIIAIFHIMISHFAVGGGLYLVLAERKALRENRPEWLKILKGHSKFFLVLTGVFGAASGVGIWFAIGLAHPEATSTLIHNFVFGWAIEWIFFMVELTTAAVYYYSWGRVSDELHLKVGWLYAIASFFTLVIINGILSFMLTPGDAWLAVAMTGKEADMFWQAFFNPTYWPNLIMRTLVCVSLAGIWALVTCSRLDGDQYPKLKTELVRWSAKWLIPSFLLMPVAMGWYLLALPDAQYELLKLGISTIGSGAFTQVTRVGLLMVMTSATIVLVIYFIAWRSPSDFTLGHALAVLFLGLIATGSGEYTRETLRKPFVVGQHMYSNGVRKQLVARYNQDGYLANSPWVRKSENGDPKMAIGEAMFRGQCMSCHTKDAYRSMKRLLAGRNREAIENVLKILHQQGEPYRRYMPPLVGTKDEIAALGDYLATLSVDKKTATEPAPAKPVAATK